ncbi:hypothetical protein SLEP1_g17009 [Rubroshorea leprosula]|uniref:Methenyltetrahydrofolate cyclohydrolase n=1 Tax=Rubroshorea leprosula TaxID=152421 RepID=A0AAV5J1X8_9ROSI|nr:hypothetical protein SLEP1_g17009 [Rubroshorea leprosula]
MKRKACAEVGIKSFDVDLLEQVSEAELISKVHELNANPDVHGILVQLPLPKHVNEEKVLGEISIEKDVDGFHPLNIGKLAMKGREPLFQLCTAKGCLELLTRSGISIKRKKVVVVGRSNMVGLPVSLLLLKADVTVTVVHSRTPDPETLVREADIVIAAAGQAMMIKGSWTKPGPAVIDVGTNAVDDPSKKSGYRLVGDVDFQEACKVAGWITTVPGGVGPMTVAMLLKNTLDIWCKACDRALRPYLQTKYPAPSDLSCMALPQNIVLRVWQCHCPCNPNACILFLLENLKHTDAFHLLSNTAGF